MQPGSAALQTDSPLSIITTPLLSEVPYLPPSFSFFVLSTCPHVSSMSGTTHFHLAQVVDSDKGSHIHINAHTGLSYCTFRSVVSIFSNVQNENDMFQPLVRFLVQFSFLIMFKHWYKPLANSILIPPRLRPLCTSLCFPCGILFLAT